MKYNLSTMEKVEKASTIGLLQVLCVVLEDKCTIIQEKYFTGLFYVPVVFNGRLIDTMVETGVNHNSMKEDVLRELGLQTEFTWTSFK
jgi:predicted aspartyl protease